MLKRLSQVLFLVAAFSAGPSHAFLENWYLDPDGASGTIGRVSISEFLDVVGASYIQTSTPTPSGAYTFSQWGAINSNFHDGGVGYTDAGGNTFGGELTALFATTGSATLGGPLSFAPGGVIEMYSQNTRNFGTNTASPTIYGANDGTLIARFSIVGGGGQVDTTGIPNGLFTLQGRATFMAPGYFFSTDGVTDLSTQIGPNGQIFGFATTNASRTGNPSTTVVTQLVNRFANDGTFTNCLPNQRTGGCTGPGEFIVGSNGQFRLTPEPTDYALLALSFGLAGWFARRRLMRG